jgi:hypothetical protein
MAAEAEGLQIRPLDGNYKTCLTRIGLLMEGRIVSSHVLSCRRHPSVRTFLSPYSFLYLIGVISIQNVSEAHLTSRIIRVLAPFLDVSW